MSVVLIGVCLVVALAAGGFRVLRRSRVPLEVQACLALLEITQNELRIGSELSRRLDLWGGGVDQLCAAVRVKILEVNRTVLTVRDRHVSPQDVVHLLLCTEAQRLISTGEFVAYGRMMMQGDSLPKVFDYAAEQLVKTGYFDRKTATDHCTSLKALIRTM
jgi:hypothetical protein